ncbi:MAG: hypothetical protein COB15_05770 [Flavobacteriales bacterium]|nr:MAG: hypothetical protein COB15_05770 [Flavobacteriales bacterium]
MGKKFISKNPIQLLFVMKVNRILLLGVLVLSTVLVFAGGPPPANDACAGAIDASGVTSSAACTVMAMDDATLDTPLSSCNTSTEDQTTWYSFVATSTDMTATGDNGATSGNICKHSTTVYSGTCGSLTEIGCNYDFDIVGVPLTGLTVGATYFVQISYASGGPCGDLEICFYVCDTPTEDACAGAIAIGPTPQSLDNFCTTPGPISNTPTITPANLCAGSLENTAWYSFTVLNTADVIMTIDNIICTGGGAGFQIGFYTGACGSLANFGCVSGAGGTVTVTLTGLTAGMVVTVAIDGNAGANCTYDISATNTTPPLPIELISFTANVIENTFVDLDWATATEINNNFFTIERSKDGETFEVVGIVDGAGNSTMVNEYDLVDEDPYKGTSYYRLKQTDYDGVAVYSDIAAVTIKSTFTDLNVFPNPVEGVGYLTFSTDVDNVAEIVIYDVAGKRIVAQQYEVLKGNNKLKLPIIYLPQGMYFLTVGNDKETSNIKFVRK